MKKVAITILKYLAAFGIGIILIWWSFRQLSSEDIAFIKNTLSHARMWLVIPVFMVLILSHWIRAVRWRQLLEPLNYNPPPLLLLCGILIGYIGNQIFPRAGDIVRCTAVARNSKIPVGVLIGTMVAERAVDMVSLLLIAALTFFMEYEHISAFGMEILTALKRLIMEGDNLVLLLIIIAIGALIIFFIYKMSKTNKMFSAIRNILKGVWAGLISLKNVRNKPLFFLNTVLIWVCYTFSTWIGCFALEETSGLKISTGIVMLVFGSLGLLVSPGGIGSYPIAIQKTLSFYDINSNVGLASGWMLWLAQFIFTIIFGTAAYFLIQKFKKSKA